MEILVALKNSDIVWLILALCSVFGVYIGHKGLAPKTISAVLSSNELIINKQPNISKVKIFYDNESVDRLTVTRLTFWNKTAPPIHNTDIIDAEPLTIFTEGKKILDVSVLKGKDTSNRINITLINDTSANITFDYLNKKEGGIIQIVHTGDHNAINITRKIIGGKVKVKKFSDFAYKRGIFISLILALLVFALYQYSDNWGIALLVSILVILFTVLTMTFNYKDLYKDYIPKNCRKNASHRASTTNERKENNTKD